MPFEQAERHSPAVLLEGLRKLCWRSQRAKAAGEIFESLLGEVTAAVVTEQGAINLSLLQPREDFARLILLLAGIGLAGKQIGSLPGTPAPRSDRRPLGTHDPS